jgi:hypothetical protein
MFQLVWIGEDNALTGSDGHITLQHVFYSLCVIHTEPESTWGCLSHQMPQVICYHQLWWPYNVKNTQCFTIEFCFEQLNPHGSQYSKSLQPWQFGIQTMVRTRDFLVSTPIQTSSGAPSSLLFNGYLGSVPGVKWHGHNTDYPPTARAMVKNE